jgi:DNA-binding CsgD family transcriptional regulator/tetratricopeptide (TPR) repeat protein
MKPTPDVAAAVSGRERGPAKSPASRTKPAHDIVGRERELDRLSAIFDEVAGGRALTVLVGGDAGIGKSRLVEEFCDRLRLRGAVVATGLCVPADGGLPYAPVIGILRTLATDLGLPSAGQLFRELGADSAKTTSPAVYPPIIPPSVDELAAGIARTVFFESILATVLELADQAPVVLVVEDLHWADSGSAALVDFLARNVSDRPVLIIGTYRREDFHQHHPLAQWMGELLRLPRVTQLDLDGLELAAVAMLIQERLGQPPDPLLLDALWTRAQGNPFYTEQLLAAPGADSLPSRLQGVIMTRVRALTPSTQHLLTVAAFAGAVVNHRLLVLLGHLEGDELAAALREAVERDILVVDASLPGYVFRHALLREAIVEELLPAERARIHVEIALALTATPSLSATAPRHRTAELAAHWWAAEEWAATLQPSLDAVGAAVAVGAFPEALTFLEHALTSAERAPDAAAAARIDRVKLLVQGADLAYLAGAHERAVELANAVIEAADDESDPLTAARGYTLLGRDLWCTGDSATAFQAYQSAEGLLAGATPSIELALLLAEEAHWYILMSRWVAGAERAQEALDQARAVGARQVEGSALNTLGVCRGSLGFEDEGIALLRDSLVIAEEMSDPEGLIHAYRNLAAMLLDASRLEEAVSIMFDGAASGEDLWGLRLSGASINGVEALVRMGRWAEAEQVLRLPRRPTFGPHASWDWRRTLAGPMMIRRGHFEVARQVLAAEREMTSGLYDVMGAAAVLGMFAELELESGRPDAAEAHAVEALALAAQSDDETMLPEFCMWGARAIADQCERDKTKGHRPDLVATRLRCNEFVTAVHRTVLARQARGVTQTPRSFAAEAQTAAERSRLDRSDERLWDRAAVLWEVAREPYPRAYCRWRQAEALLESRAGRTRAGECLDEAWRISSELGTAPLTARIISLAQRARVQLSDAEVRVPAPAAVAAAELGLTVREVEVLGQLAAGRSDREIGELLFISKKTASVHVSNVLRKLSVSNRVAAGKIGQAHGLTAPSGSAKI